MKVLSACSVFFKDTFKENPCKHPIVILKGVSFQDLEAVVQFMYNGQVNVTQERLSSFIETAEMFQIKGFTEPAVMEEATTVPAKKRSQTFPSQASTLLDSLRQDDDAMPPTPKRKRIIGNSLASAQNNELPGAGTGASNSAPLIPRPTRGAERGPLSSSSSTSSSSELEHVFPQERIACKRPNMVTSAATFPTTNLASLVDPSPRRTNILRKRKTPQAVSPDTSLLEPAPSTSANAMLVYQEAFQDSESGNGDIAWGANFY